MGCNCYEDKKNGSTKGNPNEPIIVSKTLPNKNKNKKVKDNKTKKDKDDDKISSLSSFISENSINNMEKTDSKKIKNENIISKIQSSNIDFDFMGKTNNLMKESKDKEIKNESENNININSKNEYSFNITKINLNYNKKENIKYKFKQSQINQVKDLVNLIKKDMEKDMNKTVILFYKGNRVKESDTILNLLNRKNDGLECFFNNSNTVNKLKESNEIDFDMISFSVDEEEENIDDDSYMKNDDNSFSHDENVKAEKINKNTQKKKNKEKEKEIAKKIMHNLTPLCKIHTQEPLIYICLTCFNSYCPIDFKEHRKEFKEHELIPKNKLIDLNYDVKQIKLNLCQKYKEIMPDLNEGRYPSNRNEIDGNENDKLNYISPNDLFIKLKLAINGINEELENLYNSYKNSYNKMNSKFISVYENKMPKLIEFDEYIDKSLKNFENSNIFANENIFIDNYNNCLNIKKISNNYYNSIIWLKDIILRYKEFLEIFKEKGKELIEYIKKGLDNIMKFKNGDKIFDLNGPFLKFNEKTEADIMSKNDNTLIKTNSNANFTSNITNNFRTLNNASMNTSNKDFSPTINLRFLFSDKKKRLSKSVMSKNLLFNSNNNNISNGCSINKKSRNQNKFFNNTSIKEEDLKDKKISINMNKDKDKLSCFNNGLFKLKPLVDNIEKEGENEIKGNEYMMKSPSNISSKFHIKFDLNSPMKESFSNISRKEKEKELVQNILFSLIFNTKDLIKYIPKEKKLEVISPDISILKIKKFESYIACINFNNKFYISGGYSTSKQFFEYDVDSNKFIKLPEMLSNHYYHTMIGNNNYIYSVSGFKSKKVERYDISNKEWTSLPDLAYERSYSNLLIYNKKLFVFGKINKLNNENNENNIIEYLSIENEDYNSNKWISIEIDIKFPFNSGLIKNGNNILLVGGKMDLNENSIDTCYNMSINEEDEIVKINIKINDVKLKQADEFNGNSFYCLDKKGLNYGLFSSINPNLFCIYKKEENKFIYIDYNNDNDNEW